MSAVGKSEEEYRKITYDTTIHFAQALHPNPSLSFVYVSGGGTDSTENGSLMWARVKGKTENDLMKMPFKQAFGFRIGFVKAAEGQQFALPYYKYVNWLFPILNIVAPSVCSTMKQVADAMIYVSQNGYPSNVIYIKDIREIDKILIEKSNQN